MRRRRAGRGGRRLGNPQLIFGTPLGLAVAQALDGEGRHRAGPALGQMIIYPLVAGVAGAVAGIVPATRTARMYVWGPSPTTCR